MLLPLELHEHVGLLLRYDGNALINTLCIPSDFVIGTWLGFFELFVNFERFLKFDSFIPSELSEPEVIGLWLLDISEHNKKAYTCWWFGLSLLLLV